MALSWIAPPNSKIKLFYDNMGAIVIDRKYYKSYLETSLNSLSYWVEIIL
jgi:hypothetical protein